MKHRNLMIAIAAIAIASFVVAELAVSGVIPLGSTFSCFGVSGSSRTFTIVADLNGFNGSKTATPTGLGIWPTMTVSRCDRVTIRLDNTDTQTHGLAVGVYAMPGIQIPAHQVLSLSFTADKTGQFRIYCSVFYCTVHDYMQNGQLNVT